MRKICIKNYLSSTALSFLIIGFGSEFANGKSAADVGDSQDIYYIWLAEGSLSYFSSGEDYKKIISESNKPAGKIQLSQIEKQNPQDILSDGIASQDSQSQSKAPDNDTYKNSSDEEIVVTGTHIRGAKTSVGDQVISINREDINRSGYSNVRDVLSVLPQNFGGGATEELQNNSENFSNVGKSSTVNLRGLGSVATLVLLNGRRLPAGGFNNSAVDISFIPLAAIERVEVLPDGASAVYGSDAVAGVVNFLLRKDFDGAETRGRFGLATEGGYKEYQFSQVLGRAWETGHGLISYEFRHTTDLNAYDLPWARNNGDFRSRGGKDRRFPANVPGHIVDPSTLEILFVVPENSGREKINPNSLLPASAARYPEFNRYIDIIPDQERHSVFANFAQDINDSVNFFAEARFSHKSFESDDGSGLRILFVPADNPYYIDAFGTKEPIFVGYSFHAEAPPRSDGNVKNYGIVTGLTLNHKRDWQTEAYLSGNWEDTQQHIYNRIDSIALSSLLSSSTRGSAFNPFGNGTSNSPEILQEIIIPKTSLNAKSKVNQAQIVTTGPLFSLDSNKISIALGLDYRKERFERRYDIDVGVPDAKFSREVAAAFGEIFIPVISQENDISGLYSVEISASLRHESYRDKSLEPEKFKRQRQSSTDPRIGIVVAPTASLRFNASYGTSFRAPGLYTLAELPSITTLPVPDITAPTGRTYSLIISGSQPLDNETATTWTLGLDYREPRSGNFQVKASWFRIRFKDQVTTPFAFVALSDPNLTSIVIRNPTLEQIQAACSLAPPSRQNVGPGDCSTPGLVNAIIDGRAANFSKTYVDGIDLQIGYIVNTVKLGVFNIGLNATYLIDYNTALSPDAKLTNNLNHVHYPIDFRGRASINWTASKNINVGTFVNYTDDYYDNINRRGISSHLTFDFTLTYDFGEKSSTAILNQANIQLSITNLFNNNPPFYENASSGIGYDPENADALGRFVALTLTKKF